jgi:spore coat polysaccharide biosynthesis predicted glycosyltransferase SpsG
MMQNLNIPLNEFGIVIEFGGGYGNTCRLFRKWGHDKTYIIYDIQELISIQKHYLNTNNITDVNYLSGLDGIAFQPIEVDNKSSLFLGLWSITETPRHERKAHLDRLDFFNCDNIFIAMGGTFYDENNLEWLNEEVIPLLDQNNYKHKLIPIVHGSDMWYFVAQKG